MMAFMSATAWLVGKGLSILGLELTVAGRFIQSGAFTVEVIEELAKKIEVLNLEEDEILFRKGDDGDALYILSDGWVKMVSVDKDGGEMVINQAGPGSIIGEMALIDNEPRSAGVTALSTIEMLKLSREDFLDVLEHQPTLGLQITRNIIGRLRFSTTYIENAIEWSKRIAAGDYSFMEEHKRKEDSMEDRGFQSDQERANRFLGNFFSMVEDIKAREDELKNQVVQLKIEIDQVKRKQEVSELADSEFFKNLKASKKKGKKDSEDK